MRPMPKLRLRAGGQGRGSRSMIKVRDRGQSATNSTLLYISLSFNVSFPYPYSVGLFLTHALSSSQCHAFTPEIPKIQRPIDSTTLNFTFIGAACRRCGPKKQIRPLSESLVKTVLIGLRQAYYSTNRETSEKACNRRITVKNTQRSSAMELFDRPYRPL